MSRQIYLAIDWIAPETFRQVSHPVFTDRWLVHFEIAVIPDGVPMKRTVHLDKLKCFWLLEEVSSALEKQKISYEVSTKLWLVTIVDSVSAPYVSWECLVFECEGSSTFIPLRNILCYDEVNISK